MEGKKRMNYKKIVTDIGYIVRNVYLDDSDAMYEIVKILEQNDIRCGGRGRKQFEALLLK